MIKMVEEYGLDINDPQTIKEFKKIQQQNLDDIRLMKEGRMPSVEEREKEAEKAKEEMAKLKEMRDKAK